MQNMSVCLNKPKSKMLLGKETLILNRGYCLYCIIFKVQIELTLTIKSIKALFRQLKHVASIQCTDVKAEKCRITTTVDIKDLHNLITILN
jgi:hypothetical protein